MVYILLGTGFEEIEAVVPCDILRRGGVEVSYVALTTARVTGGHGITITADCLIDDLDFEKAEMIIIPGGLGGVESILGSVKALNAIRMVWDAGGYVAAICAGPSVLARLGLLEGRTAVCFPGMEDQMTGARIKKGKRTVRDDRLITGRSAGTALDFGLLLLETLRDRDTAAKIGHHLHYLD